MNRLVRDMCVFARLNGPSKKSGRPAITPGLSWPRSASRWWSLIATRVISANDSFYRTFKVAPGETENKLIYGIGNRQWDIPELRELLEKILPEATEFQNFKVEHDFPGIGRRKMLLNARRLVHEDPGWQMILLAIEDVTEAAKTNH